MRKNLFLSAVILTLSLFSLAAFGQTTNVKPSALSGDAASVETGKIVLRTANGDIDVVLNDKTQYFSVPPETPSLKAAVPAALTDISVGDKLLVTGVLSDDKKTIPARSVYLMSKSAIASKEAKEQQDWRTRSIDGRVVSYDLASKVIKVSVRGMGGERIVSVTPKEKVEYFRYSSESAQFSDRKKSVLTEIEIGDNIRVLGDKNADGSEIAAEQILTGSFKQVFGTITAINLEKKEITINDIQTKKDVVVVVTASSLLKQYPPEMVERLMGGAPGGGQGNTMRPPTQGQTSTQQNPQQQTPGQTPGQGGGFRAGGGGDLFDRLPGVKITDLKVGDRIGVSSMKSADPSRISAIRLASGIGPLIDRAQQQQQQQAGGNRGGGNANSNFTIPGLDGFGGN